MLAAQSIHPQEVTVHPARTAHDEFTLATFGLVCGGFVEFPNQCSAQEGALVVTAHAINPRGQLVGGGVVASFTKLDDAKGCIRWINNLDPRHEAMISTNPQLNTSFVPLR